jgi:hypothetical protein
MSNIRAIGVLCALAAAALLGFPQDLALAANAGRTKVGPYDSLPPPWFVTDGTDIHVLWTTPDQYGDTAFCHVQGLIAPKMVGASGPKFLESLGLMAGLVARQAKDGRCPGKPAPIFSIKLIDSSYQLGLAATLECLNRVSGGTVRSINSIQSSTLLMHLEGPGLVKPLTVTESIVRTMLSAKKDSKVDVDLLLDDSHSPLSVLCTFNIATASWSVDTSPTVRWNVD